VQENFRFRWAHSHRFEGNSPTLEALHQRHGSAVGRSTRQVYVQKYFPPEAKARALELVNNLLAALRDDLQTLPWMSPGTRKRHRKT